MALLRDIRYALHTLRRSPGYTAMCLGVLALGIGANVAIFSVLDSVILHALPYPNSDRLVFVWERLPFMPAPFAERMQVSYRHFEEWKRQSTAFDAMAAFCQRTLNETGLDHPRHVVTGFASPALFPMLGAQPRLGRLFTPAEERKEASGVAVLSDRYFEQRFHRDPSAIGKAVTLGGAEYVIAGVLPPRFHLPSTFEGSDQVSAEIWVPLSNLIRTEADETERQLFVAARLKPGVSLGSARAEMSGIAERMSQAEVNVRDGWTTSVFPFAVEDTSPEVRRALYVLMAAVGFLLLIGCANLANLTLARATLRSREIAVRLALGATRPRVVAQLIVESLVVSIAGAAAGLVLAEWSIKLMVAFKPEDIQRTDLISINLPVLFFAAAVSVLTTLLFGLAPAVAVSRQDLNTALKSSGGWGASGARARSRQVLIAIEVALAMVLMVGAGLMIRSFRELLAVGIGFNTERLTYTDFDLPANRYPNGASQSRFFCELIARAGTLAGASGAAVVDNPPLHAISAANFYIAGRPDLPPSQLPVSDMAHASPDYMSLIGLHLEAGRLFTEADRVIAEKDGNAPVIVNRAFVEKFLRGENPLGQRLLDGDRKRAWQIVGVISDYRPMGVENGTRPTIFWPYLKSARATLVVRSGAPINLLTAAIRDTVWSLDKDLPAAEVRPMQYYVDQWLSQRKFNTLLLGIFAALALVLGMMGVYGVLANLVASRTREIGIRVAIGASPAAIGGLVLRQSMIPVAAGAAVGLAASLLLGRFLEALLFQVHPRDPLAFAAASATILLASPLAVYLPLRRATRVSCTVALREE